jgi:hypothetical protein
MSDTEPIGEEVFGNSDNEELAYVDTEITEQWDTEEMFGELAEQLQLFDTSRHSLYDLISNVMSGTEQVMQGSEDKIQTGMTLCIVAYGKLIEKLLEQYEADDASRIIGNLFVQDEQERLGLFRALAPEAAFIDTSRDHIETMHEELFEATDSAEDRVDCLRNIFGASVGADLNSLAPHFPKPEAIETADMKRERRRRQIRGVVGDIGKMVAAATLAVVITKNYRR